MVSTRSRQATDPIDNVYGMLNAVMEDTTRMLICHVGNLDIFHQVQDRTPPAA